MKIIFIIDILDSGGLYSSPISSFLSLLVALTSGGREEVLHEAATHQISGFSAMNLSMRALHSAFSRTTTSTPRCLRYSSPPTKVLFSPMTTRETPYRRQAPVPGVRCGEFLTANSLVVW